MTERKYIPTKDDNYQKYLDTLKKVTEEKK